MRRTLLAVTAVLLATIGTTLLYVYVSTADSRARQGVQNVDVLVATVDMEAGTTDTALQAQPRAIPWFAAIPGHIVSRRDVQGKVLTVKVFRGQQLSAQMFGSAASGGLAADHRAVSVLIAEADRVPGLLKPGSKVAVMRLTQKEAVPILRDATVLNVDAKGIVTFDLPEADAETLLDGVALAQGRIMLEIKGG